MRFRLTLRILRTEFRPGGVQAAAVQRDQTATGVPARRSHQAHIRSLARSRNGRGTSASAIARAGPSWLDCRRPVHTTKPPFKSVERAEHETVEYIPQDNMPSSVHFLPVYASYRLALLCPP